MYSEDDLLPISALQHLLFCERQCALIHIEGLWADNALTVTGRALHERVHEEGVADLSGVRVTRRLPVRSLRLGLFGFADVVEFHRLASAGVGDQRPRATADPKTPGPGYRVVPVEYKRGRPRQDACDVVQVSAQALCLEEMLQVRVDEGCLYYARTRRRLRVPINDVLRATTEEAAQRLRRLLESGSTPRARKERKCDNCSLRQVCLPEAMGQGRSGQSYVDAIFNNV
jgi:CRISPR-associated exonuclease Cas4